MLSKDELNEIFSNYNEENQQRLIEGYLKFVWKIVHKFENYNLGELDDLYQVGCIGLIKAVRTFDPSFGSKFTTYAGTVIEREILMLSRQNKKKNQDVSFEELQYTDKDDNSTDFLEILDSGYNLEFSTLESNSLKSWIVTLSPKERKLLYFKYMGIPQREIGKRLGISQGYVSRLVNKLKEDYEKRFS